MTRYLPIIGLLAILISCNTENKKQDSKIDSKSKENPEHTIAEKIAHAHGYEHWKNVNEIEFTFNVDVDDKHFERAWKWQPKNDYVVSLISKDSISMFTRPTGALSALDPKFIKVDQSFINDKFWMLVPFQLVWDEGISISEPIKDVAPISKKELSKITLLYGNNGGYTPGDAYDIYFDDSYIIREWVFRKSNAAEPTMTTTFENYEDFNGIKIAKDHKKLEGNWNLYFTNIKVK